MIWAKKSLGQNFLISPRIVEAIAAAGEIQKGETVIEIGPGKGTLTSALLNAGANVVAVEKDDRLIPVLGHMFREALMDQKFKLVHADILDELNPQIAEATSGPYKVIANIPYYITGQIIRTFLSQQHKPSLMVLMVQREVATRIIARDGKESILSLSVKAYAKPELVMNVSRGNFFPIPNVDSAVIKLSHISSPFKDAAAEERFFEIVKAGFAQKRKRLAKNLEAVSSAEKIAAAFERNDIGKDARAEDVSLEKWLALAEAV